MANAYGNPTFDFYSALSGIGDTLQQNRQRAEGGRLIGDVLNDLGQPASPAAPAATTQAPITTNPADPISQRIVAAANKYGVPPDLALRTFKQESGFNQNAVSPKGAMGVTQLMPGTARDMGVNPLDLDQNIEGGVKYLKMQLDKYGTPQLALAAYNAGPGRVDRVLAGNGQLPAETQNYVSRIAGAAPQSAAPSQSAGPIDAPQRTLNPALKEKLGALFASGDPNAQKFALAIISQYITPKNYGFQTLPDGTVIRTDPLSGAVTPVFQANKPEFKQIGVDRTGNPQYGFVNNANQTARALTPQETGTAGANAGDPSLTGDDFLKTVDPARAAQVKAIVEGRMAPPGSFALKSPQVQALMRDAAQYEPGFDLTKWTQRNATARDFSPAGKSGQNVTGLNTVIGHLSDLSDKADALANFNVKFPGVTFLNQAKNALASGSGEAPIKEFEAARTAVGDELARVFRSAGMSDHEVQQWKATLDSSMTPDQIKGSVKTVLGLLDSRLSALASQRSAGMSTQLEARDLLTDKSKATLDKIGAWANGSKPAAAPTATGQPKLGAVKIPIDAVKDLSTDPSPERRKYFDDLFGAGAAQRVLGR